MDEEQNERDDEIENDSNDSDDGKNDSNNILSNHASVLDFHEKIENIITKKVRLTTVVSIIFLYPFTGVLTCF